MPTRALDAKSYNKAKIFIFFKYLKNLDCLYGCQNLYGENASNLFKPIVFIFKLTIVVKEGEIDPNL